MLHEAKTTELTLIDKIVRTSESEFALVRITETMLKKSIIDANQSIVDLMRHSKYFDYDLAIDGEKTYLPIKVLSASGWVVNTTSLYRPKAKPNKQGDPRFWPKGIKLAATLGDLLLITVNHNNLIIIPLRDEIVKDSFLQEEFESQKLSKLIESLREKDSYSEESILTGRVPQLSTTKQTNLNSSSELYISESIPEKTEIINKSHWLNKLISRLSNNVDRWIVSCSPTKSNPKDVGDTLEAEFGLTANNDGTADYNGIELKTKRRKSKTADTLFSQIPDSNLTPLKTARAIILTYGYPSRRPKRLGYIDLFVTVSNTPNQQGLYLTVNEENQIVEMRCTGNDKYYRKDHVVAGWSFSTLKKRLFEKHPVTAWILASEKLIDGNIYFKYDGLEISKTPVFSQFLLLIERGIVVYDWRGGYQPDGNGSVDKGHPFRLKGTKNRELLFGELEAIKLQN